MSKWCLADFLDTSHHWPTLTAFSRRIRNEIRLLRPCFRVKTVDIAILHRELTQIFHRVLPHPESGGLRNISQYDLPPTHGLTTASGTRFSPNLKLQDWNIILKRPSLMREHPLISLGCSPQNLHSTLTQILWLQRCLLPVVHNVLLRLCFGDLIVGARLYFLRERNPAVQQCVRSSCDALETFEHCFLTCPALQVMWDTLWVPWTQAFAVPLDWRLLLFPTDRDIDRHWKPHAKVLLLLWRMHTAVVFHATWRLRNAIYFQETQAVHPDIQVIQRSYQRHYQLVYQRSEELGLDAVALRTMLTRLGFATPLESCLPQRRVWIPRS